MRALALRVTSGSFTDRGMAAREFDMRMRQATGVAKAPHVANFVKMLLEAKLPVLLFGWHREVYDLWLNKLAAYNPLLFTGSESASQSRGIVDPLVAPTDQHSDATRIRQLAELYLQGRMHLAAPQPSIEAPSHSVTQLGLGL